MNTYMSAVRDLNDVQNGLTTTHQGGQAYEVRDSLKRLSRFLILGSEKGSYYQTAKELTAENVQVVIDALNTEGTKAIDLIVQISESGRAPKNEVALLALAIAAAYKNDERKAYATNIRQYALDRVPRVARTGTHIIQFAAYTDALRGWGPTFRKGVGNWFNQKSPLAIAQQATKYPSRKVNGVDWSLADLLRLSHAEPVTKAHSAVYSYIVDGVISMDGEAFSYLRAAERAKRSTDVNEVVQLIHEFGLPREVINTHLLKEPRVWEALLTAKKGMPMTAMIRNLGNLSAANLTPFGGEHVDFIVKRLTDVNALQSARVHPIDVIKAKFTYQSGRGQLGSNTWKPNQQITDALEEAFYLSFKNVEPTNKRILLALDVSASMTWEDVGGVKGFTPRVASAVLSMVTARTERMYLVTAFSGDMVDVNVGKHDSLDEVVNKINRLGAGGTDCSLPMKYARRNDLSVDAFVVYTDNETGYSNPSAALREYRSKSGIHDAKLVVNGMTANKFSIADPSDPNMLDVVGFDSAAPQIMSEFIRGNI